MTVAAWQPTYLLDTETLSERVHVVSVIAYAMRGDDHWRNAGEAVRREYAARFAFMLWAIKNGEISDADA